MLTAAHPVDEMERYEEGQLIITYNDSTSRLAFNTEPIQRVVDYKYDQVGDQGSIILDNVTATSSQFRYYHEITGGEAVYIGGLIGGCGDAQLQNCTVTDVVVGQHTLRVRGIGAFIGHSTGTTVEIADSCQNGTTYPDVGT